MSHILFEVYELYGVEILLDIENSSYKFVPTIKTLFGPNVFVFCCFSKASINYGLLLFFF